MSKISLLLLTTLFLTITAQAAAPVGQTIWIRASATGLFVSADQNRGAWAPLVADRNTVDAWEQFQVVDAGGGFIAFRAIGTGLFVSADQNRGTFAPLVADRGSIGTWEQFTWTDIAGGAFTLRGRGTNLFVSADLARASYAPLVSDRQSVGTWEQFTWGAVGTQPPPGAPPGFSRLVWSDEFSGTSINSANWGFDLGNGGFGNNELENYTNRPENARIENGNLVIEARRENLGGSAYTSARMKTQGKQSFGINTWVEARIKCRKVRESGRRSGCLATASARLAGRRAARSTSWRSRDRTRLRTSARFTGLTQAGNTFRSAGFSIRRLRWQRGFIRTRSRARTVRSSGMSIACSTRRQTLRTE